ncbi:cytochrome P450 [Kitasatospora sp. NBC_00458]|uniref:cytochrome P450 n=1 Tax=Kitasatospora sp. NBC_00458 TaxID=2903568 RepID=UPI002E178FC0
MAEQELNRDEISPMPPSVQNGSAELLAWLKRMRQDQPVYRDPVGIYHVFRYKDVQQVTLDPQTFSSDSATVIPGVPAELTSGMLSVTDPPAHAKLRKIAGQAFSPKRIKDLEPRVVEITEQLLADLPAAEFDFVDLFSHPQPALVIAELLGIPREDVPKFRAWDEKLLATQVPDRNNEAEMAAAAEVAMGGGAFGELKAYMLELCGKRRAQAEDDFISALVHAEVDGERLGDNEAANLCIQLLLAGHVSTTAVLGHLLLALDGNPEVAAELRADRELIPAAIEELLRHQPPAPKFARFTTVDTEVAGVAIPAKSVVMVWVLSANHDEQVFTEPDSFDIHRTPNKHVAFGHGIHFCFGSALARIEIRTALEMLFDKFDDIRVAPEAQIEYYESEMFAVKRIPLLAS